MVSRSNLTFVAAGVVIVFMLLIPLRHPASVEGQDVEVRVHGHSCAMLELIPARCSSTTSAPSGGPT
jgi:hypothetical protein